jgi:hypothetical protein
MQSTGKLLGNENGMALVTALMLGLFGMLMVAALLFMVNTGTWMSDSQKRYQTILAAAYGGNEFFVKEIIRRCRGGTQLADLGGAAFNGVVRVQPVANDGGFRQKLQNSGSFAPYVPGDNNTGDVVITFAGQNRSDINVHATIVNTSTGNAGTASGPQLLTGGVVPSPSGGGTTPHHIPYLYQIQIVAQSAANTRVRAQLDSLYVW